MTQQRPTFKHKVVNYGGKGLAFGLFAALGEAIVAAEVMSVVVPTAIVGGIAYGIYHVATKDNDKTN